MSIAMDKTGSTSTLAPKTTRRNFFQWVVKWFYASSPEDTSKKFDIPSIICLLQAAGFKLREFEKRSAVMTGNEEVKSNNIRITMECGSSKMTAVLEMDDVKCECLDNNEAKDGSFWSVTGTGPMGSVDSVNKFEETGSNLLPKMSKETTSVVREVVCRLFKLISNNCDDDQSADWNVHSPIPGMNTTITKNVDVKERLVRSYTDFYQHKPRTMAKLSANLANAKCMSSSKSNKDMGMSEKPKLERQGTYDLGENESMEEPRPSPPKLASSPIPDQLCISLGQISLQSEDEPLSLADYVVKAHQILDKAMNFIIKKLPNQSLSQDDANFVKPAAPPLMSSSFCLSSPNRRASTNNMINRSISNASARSATFSSTTRTSSNCRGSSAAATANKSMIAQRPVPTPRANALPPMRDRSSSLNAAQRPQPPLKPVSGQRRSANAASTFGLTPRPTSTNSKLPASKLTQTRGSASLAVERPVLMAKRRSSDSNSQTASPALPPQARANVSLIKAPSSASRLNTSVSAKFGYSSAKK